MMLLLFTKQTGFNLSGVEYQFNQETMMMTIEKGIWNKQVVERQVTAQEALRVVLPINEAKQLWEMNIYLIALFAAFFIALFYTPLKSKKNWKWYVVIYFTLLLAFVIWDITVHWELEEELSGVFNDLKIFL